MQPAAKKHRPLAKRFPKLEDAIAHGGVVFARDLGHLGKWKQYYVTASADDIYDFVFDQSQRDFYEVAREHTPAKLIIDLDMKTKDTAAMDRAQNEIIVVVQRQLNTADVQVLASDGQDKASRHLIFQVWFVDINNAMKHYVQRWLMPVLSKEAQAIVDHLIYTRNR